MAKILTVNGVEMKNVTANGVAMKRTFMNGVLIWEAGKDHTVSVSNLSFGFGFDDLSAMLGAIVPTTHLDTGITILSLFTIGTSTIYRIVGSHVSLGAISVDGNDFGTPIYNGTHDYTEWQLNGFQLFSNPNVGTDVDVFISKT